MKRRTFALAAVLTALTAATLLAADVTGNWSGQMAGPNGDSFDISYTFKQDGAKLTGTVMGPQGDAIEITDGKVDGDKISFTINVHDQFTLKHEGTISGDAIKLTMKSDQGDFPGGEITLKRSK
jgi:hypothetical protein